MLNYIWLNPVTTKMISDNNITINLIEVLYCTERCHNGDRI
ncbi:hypothetical protein [Abyssisolibacter fermentans]|nr:hypothetical protein [Abyssisolibacter fermentans]